MAEFTHEELMGMYRAGRLASGFPLLSQLHGDDAEETTQTIHWLGEALAGVVDEVWRLKQVIAIRQQEDRIAEQIEQGYR